jgi:predicted transposase YdaD
MDHNSFLNAARREGLKEGRVEGRAEGEKMGTIHLCERMLNRPLTPKESLEGMSLEELTRLADELQALALKDRPIG